MRKPRPTRTVESLKKRDNHGKNGTKMTIKQFDVGNFGAKVAMVILINKVDTNIRRSTGDVSVIFVGFSIKFNFLRRLSVTS
jgi:hypothetical protein